MDCSAWYVRREGPVMLLEKIILDVCRKDSKNAHQRFIVNRYILEKNLTMAYNRLVTEILSAIGIPEFHIHQYNQPHKNVMLLVVGTM